MRKRIRRRIRLIKARRSYTMTELSVLLKVHVRTVQLWHQNGMSAIDYESRPFIFNGESVKQFLTQLARANKKKLGPTEFYCPRCKVARESVPERVRIDVTNRTMGKDDHQALIKGKCRICGCRLTRFSTRKRVILSPFFAMIKEAERVLKGNSTTPSETDLNGGQK